MSTDVTRNYEYKVFEKGQIKQFAIKLARFCNISSSEVYILLHYKDDEFDTSSQVTVDELEDLCEVCTHTLTFHYNHNSIRFSLGLDSKALNILYLIDGDIEYTKKFIFFVENTLELKRLSKQEIRELTNPDNYSCTKESEVVIDYCQPIEQIQTDSDPSNILSNAKTNSLVTVWYKASNRLRLLYPEASYQTWIAPIFPSVEGNQLILNCPNEFSKDWVESRYKKDIIETVRSIEPSVEEIIAIVSGKGISQNNKSTKKLCLDIDEQLFALMTRIYEKDTENTTEWTFEKYFTHLIQSHCQDRLENLA